MQVKGNYVEKRMVKHVTETQTLEEVCSFLSQTGYRCIPVLDKDGKKFLGNVYKVQILEYEKEHSLDAPVSVVLTDKEEYICEEASFFEVFFSIKRLPYIAVTDDNKVFKGILTHAMVLEILEDSWGLNRGSFTLTLATLDYKGALSKITAIINKYSAIQSLITIDNNSLLLRRIVVTIPKDINSQKFGRVIKELEEKGIKVVHIEER